MQQIDQTKSVITQNYLGSEFNDLFFSGTVAQIKINQTAYSSQYGNATFFNEYFILILRP